MQQASTASNDTTRLPRAVQQRSERIREFQENQRAAASAAAATTATPPATDVVETPAPPATPTPTPQPPAPPVDPRHETVAYWRQRFESTAGVLRTVREQHAEEIEGMRDRVTELETEVRTLKASTSPSSSEIDLGQYFTPEQIERIGEDEARDIVMMAKKTTDTAVQAAIDAAVKPLIDRQQQEKADQKARRKAEFEDALRAAVPDYAEVDKSEGWHAWLAERTHPEDEDSTEVRQDVLTRHCAAYNAKAVAKMFLTYLKSIETPEPPITAHAEGGQNDDAGAAAPPSGPALKPLTRAEIKAFYTKSALGKVNPQERAEFEARRKLTAA